ncbi:SprT-like domain-containing protein [Polyangium aurulentum]|nr:SprT-like domain-containing protein [Polyangium aurulentum]
MQGPRRRNFMESTTEPEARERLSLELETALLRELKQSYDDINAAYFRRALKPATIELGDAERYLGRWHRETRSIEIARRLVLDRPWGVVVEVLKHEMAHQYVHEVLGVLDEKAHGPAFRGVCQKLGIDAAASGLPIDPGSAPEGETRVLERIAKLLALAESANVNEAQAAMNAAQRLMLKYNIDSVGDRAQRGYGFRHLGKPTGRVSEAERRLASILGRHFFVEVIWVPVYRPLEGKRGTVLEICGTHANLEMASYVHTFLTRTAEQLWQAHKKSRGMNGNRDRRTYVAGVMAGFDEKLSNQRKVNEQEGLVWVRDADLGRFYRARHPRIQHVKYAGGPRTEAHAEGRAAGRRIVLHRPVEGGPSGGVRLLPGKS